eukprot:3303899-Pleurochrysis_carterae.AAC.1
MCRLREALPAQALRRPIRGETAPLSLSVALVNLACSIALALGISQRGGVFKTYLVSYVPTGYLGLFPPPPYSA